MAQHLADTTGLANADRQGIHEPQELAGSKLLDKRPTWAFFFGKALTDPVWWFYLFWVPGFLSQRFHVNMAGLAVPILVIPCHFQR